jgi:hypothetical protein
MGITNVKFVHTNIVFVLEKTMLVLFVHNIISVNEHKNTYLPDIRFHPVMINTVLSSARKIFAILIPLLGVKPTQKYSLFLYKKKK